jgi:DUF1365 family protein
MARRTTLRRTLQLVAEFYVTRQRRHTYLLPVYEGHDERTTSDALY